jgi:hypothetical protein
MKKLIILLIFCLQLKLFAFDLNLRSRREMRDPTSTERSYLSASFAHANAKVNRFWKIKE